MADPYRDPEPRCPACRAPLRAYHERLVCDECTGIFVALPDLAAAIYELTSITPMLEISAAAPGTRACPTCTAPMATCKLIIHLDADVEHPKPHLDHCGAHGLWFDADKLAAVLETIATKGFGAASGHRSAHSYGGAADKATIAHDAFGRDKYGGHGPL
jgi:hypothetical protein